MRFYCESIDTESFLDPVDSRHLCQVLRAQKGTPVELFDGKGTLAEGVVQKADKKRAVIDVQNITQTPAATTGRVVLGVSFAKGQRFDWLVEKCTELGADHIAAVQFERTVKLGKKTALERYRKITIAAAKQSGRLFLPMLSGPEKFPATLNALLDQYPEGLFVYGDPQGQPLCEATAIDKGRDTIIIIGPEGGFSEQEIDLLHSHHATGVLINKNILRIETAAVAFCTAISLSRL